jgi:hypothetical protein
MAFLNGRTAREKISERTARRNGKTIQRPRTRGDHRRALRRSSEVRQGTQQKDDLTQSSSSAPSELVIPTRNWLALDRDWTNC